MSGHWLSFIIFTPWCGAAALALFPFGEKAGRWLRMAFSLSTLALTLAVLARFDPSAPGFQFGEDTVWISALHIHHRLGIDGMSLLLVLLTAIVSPIALLAPLGKDRDSRLFGTLFLALQGSALGVFLSLDFFEWFLFWELSLVPAFFLIKLWGGAGASRAAFEFFIYTIAGSALMLAGFAAIYSVTGEFDFVKLAQLGADGRLSADLAGLGHFWPQVVFVGILVGLAVKVPLFPFHTWMPSAYAEAPPGITIFLTAVMSKMGVYGFLRILWMLFPDRLHAAAGPLMGLAIAGALVGAWCAMRQTGIKRMLAYSSMNHMSYCLMAIFAAAAAGASAPAAAASALSGTLLQMFNHGICAAALFFCAAILESRGEGAGTFDEFGGVRSSAPVFAGLCGMALFFSLGLPGLSGFVGEFLIFKGTFQLVPWSAATACLGLLVTAVFLLTFWQRVFHGPVKGAAVADVRGSEFLALVPLAALMLVLGVLPELLLRYANPLVLAWVHLR